MGVIIMRKNVIYQFKVYHPYDGCYWCWAYVYVDKKSIVHFLKFTDSNSWKESIYDYSYTRSDWNTEKVCKDGFIDSLQSKEHLYCYSLNSKKDIKEMITACNENDIIDVLSDMYVLFEIDIKLPCKQCGYNTSAGELHATSYHGDGGIGIEYTDYICEDCYSTNTCEECNTYDENLDSNGLCEDCSEVKCIICGGISSTCNDHSICEDCIKDEDYIKSPKAYTEKYNRYIEDKNSQVFFDDMDSIKAPEFILI